MIRSRELINDLIGFMDGVPFAIKCTDDHLVQNAMHSSYVCNTAINNIFAYGPNGKVFFCALNFPGSQSNGAVIARFLPFLKEQRDNYKIVVDHDFPTRGQGYGILVWPMSKKTT